MSLKAEDRIVLDEGEKLTPLWAKLMKHWQEREQRLFIKLAGDLNEHDTAKVRGQLAELRSYMNLNKVHPDINE